MESGYEGEDRLFWLVFLGYLCMEAIERKVEVGSLGGYDARDLDESKWFMWYIGAK